MKGLMKIVLGVVIAGVLLIGGCVALIGGAANEIAKESEESSTGKQGSSSDDGESKTNDPSVVGNWKIENMKQIKFKEEYGSFAAVNLRVRNVSDESDTPWFEIRLTNKKGDLVASFDCIGDEYEPGQGGTVRCSTLDDFAPFTDWELKNAL